VLVGAALTATGCEGLVFQLRPVPRATAAGAPVMAQVRKIEAVGFLDDGGKLVVELDAYNPDGARTFQLGPPRLIARSLRGGRPYELPAELAVASDDPNPDRKTYWREGPRAPEPLRPGATRTIRAMFEARGEPPQGPLDFVAVLPVEGSAPIEIDLVAHDESGPRWSRPRPVGGLYLRGGFAGVGESGGQFDVIDPIGFSFRSSFGRLVTSIDVRETFLRGTTLGATGSSGGFSGLLGLTWQPWRWHVAPYAEGGGYAGWGDLPTGGVRHVGSARVSAGILLFAGPRLTARADLPIERPLSPQRALGLRVGYTRWFHTGAAGGSDGLELSYEIGLGTP
jgi:hypothetical protein